MIGRAVEIATDGRHLSRDRGFLVVTEKGTEVGRVALDTIGAVIANAHGLTYTNNLLTELAARGVPMVLCGPNHSPAAIVWPVDGHHEQSGRIGDQVAAELPLKKRIWSQIVRAKIMGQSAALEAMNAPHAGFHLLARKVRAGDPENLEAEAARRYWPLLFGSGFRRDRDAGGVNALLNYGYAVLRATVARAVMGAGLHPSLGLKHSNRANAMLLVDDLMEPFRPAVDLAVFRLRERQIGEVTPEAKAALSRLMIVDLATDQGRSPLMVCCERLAQSLAQVYAGERSELILPKSPLPHVAQEALE